MKTTFATYFLLLFFSLLTGASEIQAQQSTDYEIQANIIYRFTKYINWPDTKIPIDFVIGITGDSPLTDALQAFIAHKTAGNRKIIVRQFPATAAIFDCQILFISEEESGSLKKIVLRTAGKPILIVTEAEGLALKGSCINFSIVSDHLKLEINKINIQQRNLSIATELLQLGKLVQ